MLNKKRQDSQPPHDPETGPSNEGGLRAPPGLSFRGKVWWWFHFIVLVNLARLRFVVILAVIGIVIMQWDTIIAYYDKWTRSFRGDEQAASPDVEYFCPMHPVIVSDNPKDKCPICFMPLAKRKKVPPEPLPAGIVNRVQLTPYRIVLAGIQTWEVDFVTLLKEITAVGYVEFDERGQMTVSARVEGRIDKLHVNQTGQWVDAGDPLALLYSPNLSVTLDNLINAQRSGNERDLSDARTRLERLGIDDAQIDDILASGQATTHLTIPSPIKGHVIRKYVREGQYVSEGSALYDVADLSTVWIEAQIYEEDMPFLPLSHTHPGTVEGNRRLRVTATSAASPGEEFEGTLSFIYPHVDQETRTVTVRVEYDNPDHKLRPGSTATVNIKVPPKDVPALLAATADDPEVRKLLEQGQVLALPAGAIIDTGSQRIAYREASPGVYEGVSIEVGPKMTGAEDVVYYPVLAGLKPGDKVVTTGSFLVDAETRLNPAAGSIYFGGSGGAQATQSGRTTRPTTPVDPDATVAAGLAELAPADRREAEAQRFCPILEDSRLGSMGRPVKLMLDGRTVFICCEACRKKALANPSKTLAKVEKLKARAAVPSDEPGRDPPSTTRSDDDEAEVAAALAELSPEDRALAQAQRYCAVLEESRLGSMGVPVKLEIEGQPVFVCCEACSEKALASPQETLTTVERLKVANGPQVDDESEQTRPPTD